MSDDKGITVFNAGDWSIPANTLVKKISKCIGTVFGPVGAGANALSKTINAHGDAKAMDIAQRASQRREIEEIRHQSNMESILRKAWPHVSEDTEPEKINDDWVANFFDQCKIVSDEEVQEVWARVLAGECNRPGAFSRRTINRLRDLDRDDCLLFTHLQRYHWLIENQSYPLVLEPSDLYLNGLKVTDPLSHLIEIGLITHQVMPHVSHWSRQEYVFCDYFDSRAKVRVMHRYNKPEWDGTEQYELPLGVIEFSSVGKELGKVCKSNPISGHFDAMIERWNSLGFSCEVVVSIS